MKVRTVVIDKSDVIIFEEVKEYKERNEKAKNKLNDQIVDKMIDKFFDSWKKVQVTFL